MRLTATAAMIAALIAATLGTVPANALTLEQAQAEVAGMTCVGSTCTSETFGTRTETPDPVKIVTQGGFTDPGKAGSCDGRPGHWLVGTLNCVPATLVGSPGSGEGTYQGPTVTIDTKTTVTKELVYNGPNTDRAGAWSVVTTEVTVDVD